MKERKGVNNIIIASKKKKIKVLFKQSLKEEWAHDSCLTSGREGLHLTQASPSSPYMFPTLYLSLPTNAAL